MSQDLLLTLGHNSSAIAITEGKIYAGYEEERLSRVKSDSSFPQLAIDQIGLGFYDNIYVSHWHPFCSLNEMKRKHWRYDLLPSHNNLVSLDMDFTHHDAHMMSAQAFAGKELPNAWTIVADGFGNFGETMSIYDTNGELVKRLFGYGRSLGLMYQYAVANLGMKMNEDEYKLLGYESQISEIRAIELNRTIDGIVDNFIRHYNSVYLYEDDDPLYDISALVQTQAHWDEILEPCKRDKVSVAYVVQTALERILKFVVMSYNMEDVILVGGVFLNVKANNRILNIVPGKVAVMPLSGDQGAAIGLYKRANPEWVMPESLAWGWRKLTPIKRPRTICFDNKDKMARQLLDLLRKDCIVNVIQGPMEFGPRALCNTSTIAMPTPKNVEYINKINGRSTIMPMGPVVNALIAPIIFPDLDRVVKSADYMVTALDYHDLKPGYMGAAHEYPFNEGFSGRPQLITANHRVLGKAIDVFHILINTSFNIHGVPICYDSDDIETCIDYQQERDTDNRVYTLILMGVHDV